MAHTKQPNVIVLSQPEQAHVAAVASLIMELLQETELCEPDPAVVRAAVTRLIKSRRKHFSIAVNQDGRVVGVLVAAGVEFSESKNGHYLYVTSLYCTKDYRRRGVASQLINRAIESARQEGYLGLRLLCHIDNRDAARWYPRRGFKQLPYLVFESAC